VEDLNGPVDMAAHIRDTKESLAEIEKDIHCLMDMEKKEAEDMTEGFDSGMLAGLLSKQGVDPGIVAMLNDRCKDGNWGDGGMLIVLFLILILGFGGNGGWFGNRNGAGDVAGVDRTVVNEANYSRMMDAISTQGTRQEMAVNQLANALNCDCNSIKSALCGLDKQLALTNGNVINAIQNVGCQLGQQISSCCCETRRAIENQGCQTRADIQDVRFLISSSQASQDNLIQSQFAAQNAYLADQFCQIQMRELEATNQRLRDEIFRQSQNAQTAQILTAIANKDAITFSGTAGATAFNGTGSIS
jgi:hypothetical protein